MNYIKILNQKEKGEIKRALNEQFAVDSIPGILAMRGQERIFLFTGNLDEKEIKKLEDCTFIERLGVYFAKIVDGKIRLSLEGSQVLSAQIKKNILSLDFQQAEEWMKGHELPIKTGNHGFMVIKHKEDFLGTGKASEKKIGNFIPKNRRLREKS